MNMLDELVKSDVDVETDTDPREVVVPVMEVFVKPDADGLDSVSVDVELDDPVESPRLDGRPVPLVAKLVKLDMLEPGSTELSENCEVTTADKVPEPVLGSESEPLETMLEEKVGGGRPRVALPEMVGKSLVTAEEIVAAESLAAVENFVAEDSPLNQEAEKVNLVLDALGRPVASPEEVELKADMVRMDVCETVVSQIVPFD